MFVKLLLISIVCLGAILFFGKAVIGAVKVGKICHLGSAFACERQTNPVGFWSLVLFCSMLVAMSSGVLARATYDVLSVIPTEDESALREWNDYAQRCSDAVENPDVALDYCTRVVNLRNLPNIVLAIALSNRGLAYARKADYERAIEDLSEALRLEPSYSIAFLDRGGVYASKGDYDRAIQDFNQALLYDPKNAYAYYGRGYAYRSKEDYERAIQDYDAGIQLDPKNAEAVSDRGYVYARKGDDDRAIQDYSEAIRLEPRNTLAFIRRGSAYYRKEDFKRAVQEYEEAIKVDPKDARGFRGKGRALFYLGRFRDAQAGFIKAIELESKDAYGPLWLSLVRGRLGQDGKNELLANAKHLDLQTWPGPIVKLYLGSATGEEVLHLANSSESRKHREQHCEAYFYLAQQALIQGKEGEAVKLFKATLDTKITNFVEYRAAEIEL
jgi:tetratricopeptide (TPR) repeat protein